MNSDILIGPNDLLRFSDMIEEPRRRLAPLRGYENMKLVSLEEATDPLVPDVPEIKYMVYNALTDSSLINDSLSIDERASIILYSMEWTPKENSFYRFLNRILRSPRRADWLPPWFLFLKLFLTALVKLSSNPRKLVYRGIKMDVKKDYPEGSKIIWWGFSSCTARMDVLEDEKFIGKSDIRTLFTIECDTSKDIRKYTLFPDDEEILLLPGSEFQVVSSVDAGNGLHMIHLKELKPRFPHIASVVVESLSTIDKCFTLGKKCTESSSRKIVSEPKSPLEVSYDWQEFRYVADAQHVLNVVKIENKCTSIDITSNKITPEGTLMIAKAIENNKESNLSPQLAHCKEPVLDKKSEYDRSHIICFSCSKSEHSAVGSSQTSSVSSKDEEKIVQHVIALVQKYTENYSEKNDRPIKEAVKDVLDVTTSNIEQQAIIVRELFINVLKLKPYVRKAIGHLLNIILHKNIISEQGLLSGIKMVIESIPILTIDIPLILQQIGEIIGAFIGGPPSNLLLLKPILQMIPNEQVKELFQYIIRYALELSSKSQLQKLWQSSSFSLSDLIRTQSIDAAFMNEFNWLSEIATNSINENPVPHVDQQLVNLFRSISDQDTKVSDTEIVRYIQTQMDPADKFFIRNIVLSYLEACLVNREGQMKIQNCIAKIRMTVVNQFVNNRLDAEVQVVYAIQNFLHQMNHPPKIAQELFDMFYDEECVSEDAFFEWFKNPDQSETEGHAAVKKSTKDFFTWLQQAETEVE